MYVADKRHALNIWIQKSSNQKGGKSALIKSDQVDFNAKSIICDKEGHVIIIKDLGYQEEVYT